MSDAYYVGAIAMQTQQRALEVIANNIANVNTAGFKRDQIRFTDLVASGSPDNADRSSSVVAGVTLDRQTMVEEAGELQQTASRLDLAIDGAGFIELLGPGGQTLLWRGGALKIGEDGLLSGGRGFPLKAAITVPRDATAVTIAGNGKVTASVPGETDPVEIGEIALVRMDNVGDLERLDGGLYRASPEARLSDAAPGEDGAGLLVQGAIERSNVALTDEMVQLILIQRAYAANAQIVQAADQLMAIANELRR